MTNEELDRARVDEAMRLWDGSKGSLAAIAARLAREGWTPPKVVDPDLIEAQQIFSNSSLTTPIGMTLTGIKRGRALAAAEAKPGLVWVKHDGWGRCPVALEALVVVKYDPSAKTTLTVSSGEARYRDWESITHYAIITPPAEDAA